jgi:hypothetical protein
VPKLFKRYIVKKGQKERNTVAVRALRWFIKRHLHWVALNTKWDRATRDALVVVFQELCSRIGHDFGDDGRCRVCGKRREE